jgi:hypothetical protein
MTLAYEDEASTTDGFAEQATTAWVVPVSRRKHNARGASLAALDGMPISSRFCSWLGLSGRRYTFSVYPARDCPALHDAVLLAVVRDMTGQRRVVSVRETGSLPETIIARTQREVEAFAPGLEFHLYLLGASAAERAEAVADLEIAQA